MNQVIITLKGVAVRRMTFDVCSLMHKLLHIQPEITGPSVRKNPYINPFISSNSPDPISMSQIGIATWVFPNRKTWVAWAVRLNPSLNSLSNPGVGFLIFDV
jgi:hypothetical protein